MDIIPSFLAVSTRDVRSRPLCLKCKMKIKYVGQRLSIQIASQNTLNLVELSFFGECKLELSILHAVSAWHGPSKMPAGIVTKKKKSFKWQIWKQIGYYFRMCTL